MPEGATLFSSVWQMQRKRKPSTGEISINKAGMNIDGTQLIKGLHYEESYAPVVQWATIRFFISLVIFSNWHTRQLDFVLAYTQADIEKRDLYMKLPAGFRVPGRSISTLKELKLGFKPSEHDECVFYYAKTIFIVYTDDTMLLGPDKDEIDTLVKRLGKTFKIEDQGELSNHLGFKIEKKLDGTLEWTQPTLTQSILRDLKIEGEEIKGRQN